MRVVRLAAHPSPFDASRRPSGRARLIAFGSQALKPSPSGRGKRDGGFVASLAKKSRATSTPSLFPITPSLPDLAHPPSSPRPVARRARKACDLAAAGVQGAGSSDEGRASQVPRLPRPRPKGVAAGGISPPRGTDARFRRATRAARKAVGQGGGGYSRRSRTRRRSGLPAAGVGSKRRTTAPDPGSWKSCTRSVQRCRNTYSIRSPGLARTLRPALQLDAVKRAGISACPSPRARGKQADVRNAALCRRRGCATVFATNINGGTE